MTIIKEFERPDEAAVDAFKEIDAATLHEGAGRTGAMVHDMKPIYPGMKVAGPALTVNGHPGDNLIIHYALTLAQPGDVLVVDTKGFTECGHWGDIMTTGAQAAGVAGLVIDGAIRDAEVIRDMGFSVFCRGVSMKGPTKLHDGDVNVPVMCGGVSVAPGDIVVGDDDGVVVIAQADAGAALKNARKRLVAEEEKRARIKAGETTADLLGVRDLLKSMGID